MPEEFTGLLNIISDLSGQLDYSTRELFWKREKYIRPNLEFAMRINAFTLSGKIKSFEAPKALWSIAQEDGYYAIRIDAKRTIFVHYKFLVDIRDELADLLKKQNGEKLKAQQAKLAQVT